MIRIPILEKQKQEIETIYWNWIKKYHLKALLNIVKRDDVLKDMIMDNAKNITEAIKKYLLADSNDLAKMKSDIDNRNKKIKEQTKEYLLARYKNYRTTQAAKIIHILDITVCPYCNQNHINIVYAKDGKIKLWGDLDHFYDKSTYPELAICLYNLIPVCKVCNQLKSSKKREISNPFNCNVNSNIMFQTKFDEKLDLDYIQGKSQNFNIIIDESQLSKIDREEIALFDLKNRYKELKRNVQEIIIKSKAYDSLYEKQLMDKFELRENQLREYIFGYTDNHLNRILSKFNYDIMNEFKTLINKVR